MRSAFPKVLQPLAGRPLLAHVLDRAAALQADDVCVVYGHGGEQVRAAFPSPAIRWALQAEQLGTGHAMLQAMPGTPQDNRVLVLFGDVPLLTTETLAGMLAAAQGDDLLVLTVDMKDPTGYGRIIRDDDGVTGIVEDKDASDAQKTITEINTGVMLCPGARLKAWVGRFEVEVMGINDKKQLAEAERALQAKLVEELMANGVGFADPARVDIRGQLTCGRDVFIDVNAVFEGQVTLGDGVRIEANNVIRDSALGNGVVVHPNCHMDGAVAGDDCEIGPFARLRPGAELATRVKVGNFVEIKKSTVADGSKVNHLTYIGDSEIGVNVNVGAGTITCNYDGANKHRTKIGDGAFIGSSVNFVAPVEVGSGATIGAGSTITKDAPAEELTLERSKQVTVRGWKRPTKKV
jgi:bifunctional UDP-N-acetylglucosamine pyrophosphorylase/glucosamine-1-phosphate N-acetyltransferase